MISDITDKINKKAKAETTAATEIIKAQNCGFCYGVRNAVKQTYDAIENTPHRKIYLLGKLIHNDKFIGELVDKGAIVIDDSVSEDWEKHGGNKEELKRGIMRLGIEDGSVVILRAHGVSKEIYEALSEIQGAGDIKNIEIIDTTCNDVKKIHRLIAENADSKTFTIILGDKSHPEIRGVKSYVSGGAAIYKNFDELKSDFPLLLKDEIEKSYDRLIVLSQTTHNTEDYEKCREFIKSLCKDSIFFDTICGVTGKRQAEAEEISKIADVMIVVGGTGSSNTKKLYGICRKNCENTFIIETSEQLPLYILQNLRKTRDIKKGAMKVGITAGASTPDRIIKEVETRIMADTINGNNAVDSEMSFQEMLDSSDSFVILNRGSKVKGTISSISTGEIHVDLGTKHTGILTFDEITDDSSVKLSEMFKVGDEIETQVLKINDVEGTALLSKKRIDSTENWEKIVQFFEDGTIIEGKIVQVVNGGLIALTDAVKLFVPASQANVSKETNLQTLINKRVRMKVIDINIPKHRAIASIRAAYNDERKAGETKIWGEIEIGKSYSGVVKSIVNYGAFVDIGGVDGMVHITELSWSRIKHPSEIVKLGDEVEVYIKDFDAEKRRISLGYRNENDNPWKKFLSNSKVGDVVDVKIQNMMPFGAFAEIFPGVDGLIHISQISDRKIARPAEILSVGEIVQAKITDINETDKKISLSIRALTEIIDSSEPVGETEDVLETDTGESVVAETAESVPEAETDGDQTLS